MRALGKTPWMAPWRPFCELQCISQDVLGYTAMTDPIPVVLRKKTCIFTQAAHPRWGTILINCVALLTDITSGQQSHSHLEHCWSPLQEKTRALWYFKAVTRCSGSERTSTIFAHHFLKNLFTFYWRIIVLQNFAVFCQISTWISHRYTYIPSLLNLPPISLPIPPL